MRCRCWLMLFATLLTIAGCTTTRTSDTPRTALEQLLISNAVDQSLDKFDFASLYNRKVYIDDKYLECVDKGYLLASIRERVLVSGGRIVSKADDSDVTLEVRTGGLGTDNLETYVGMPALSVPGIMPIELPQIKIWNRTSQKGTAKIGILAMDTKSGGYYNHGGQALARSDDNSWYLLGVGPFQDGSVRTEVTQGTRSNFALSRRSAPTDSPVYLGSGRRPDSASVAPPNQPQQPMQPTPPMPLGPGGLPAGIAPPGPQVAQPVGYYSPAPNPPVRR
jgi:hypothetical protein